MIVPAKMPVKISGAESVVADKYIAMNNGFTLLELIIVIIIIGILAVLGLTQYTRVTENSRIAEARAILGAARKAEIGYYVEKGDYATSFSSLGLPVPGSCTSTHYFWYGYNDGTGHDCGGAYLYCRRCTAGGKLPDYAGTQYTLRLAIDSGIWCNDTGY